MVKTCIVALVLAVAMGAPAHAQGGDDIWTRLINQDTATRWDVQPNRPRPQVVDAPSVPGESALRVRVTAAAANPWEVQASSPVGGAINAGDVILLMFYARAETPAEGGSVLPVRIQQSGAPYAGVLESREAVSGDWAQRCAHGVAGASYPAGGTNVSVHLGHAAQTIDLGAVFVFNLGPDFDRTRLPDCG